MISHSCGDQIINSLKLQPRLCRADNKFCLIVEPRPPTSQPRAPLSGGHKTSDLGFTNNDSIIFDRGLRVIWEPSVHRPGIQAITPAAALPWAGHRGRRGRWRWPWARRGRTGPGQPSAARCDSVTVWQCDSVTVWQFDSVTVWQWRSELTQPSAPSPRCRLEFRLLAEKQKYSFK